MASYVYNQGLLKIANGTVDYLTDDIRVLVVNQNYTFDKAHDFVNDVVSFEVANSSGTGYERKALANKSVSLVADSAIYDADNVLYTAVTTTQQFGGWVVYKEGATDAARDLIAFIDFNNLVTNGSDIQININENGLFRITNVLA